MPSQDDIRREYLSLISAAGSVIAEPAPQEVWRRLQSWRKAFAADLHARTGKWAHGDYDWHVFSFDFARSIRGERAVIAAQEHIRGITSLTIAPKESYLPAIELSASTMPELRTLNHDILIWPSSFEWTIAYTHEDASGMGPFFCKREWILSLDPSG